MLRIRTRVREFIEFGPQGYGAVVEQVVVVVRHDDVLSGGLAAEVRGGVRVRAGAGLAERRGVGIGAVVRRFHVCSGDARGLVQRPVRERAGGGGVGRDHGPAIVIARVAVAVTLGRGLGRIGGCRVIHGGFEVHADEVLGDGRIGIKEHGDPAAGRYLGGQVHADGVARGVVRIGHRTPVNLHGSNRWRTEASRHRDCHPVHARRAATDGRLDVVAEGITGGTGGHVVRADLGAGGADRGGSGTTSGGFDRDAAGCPMVSLAQRPGDGHAGGAVIDRPGTVFRLSSSSCGEIPVFGRWRIGHHRVDGLSGEDAEYQLVGRGAHGHESGIAEHVVIAEERAKWRRLVDSGEGQDASDGRVLQIGTEGNDDVMCTGRQTIGFGQLPDLHVRIV